MLLFSHGSFLWAADLVRRCFFMKSTFLYLESAPRRIIPITPAENKFAGSYCEHHKRDRKVNAISVTKHKRNDHNVGNDRRDRGCPFACIAKLVGKECTNKCGNASENDVNRNRTAKKIGDDTSHEQSRDAAGVKNGSTVSASENRI